MKIEFSQERVTKNTVRFAELVDNSLDTPKIGTLYVQKSTLKELGYSEGLGHKLSLELTAVSKNGG